MPLLILLILIGLPLAEISVFIEVGGQIGAASTIMLTVATAVAGLTLARLQGFAVMVRMQDSMARGQPPVEELVHGFFLFLGGVFLLVPGFLTDGLGILLLLPPVRMFIGRAGLRRFAAGATGKPGPGGAHDSRANVEIEGVYWEGEDEDGADNTPTTRTRRED